MATVWLDCFEIHKLWGSRNIKKDVSSPVTIMHGANGTGKTTIMNLIAACMSVDIKTLNEIDFKSIRLTFRAKKGWNKPIVDLHRTIKRTGQYKYLYNIKEKTTSLGEKFEIYSDDDVERHAVIRHEGGYETAYYVNSVLIERVKDEINKFVSILVG